MVTICTTSLTFNNLTFCPHSVFMCFVWIWEQTAIISLYSINWLGFITETQNVYCAVRTDCSFALQVKLNPCVICGGHNGGTWTGFSPSISGFPCQYHSTNGKLFLERSSGTEFKIHSNSWKVQKRQIDYVIMFNPYPANVEKIVSS